MIGLSLGIAALRPATPAAVLWTIAPGAVIRPASVIRAA